MSARFTRRARLMTFAGLATLGLAAVAQLAVSPAATSAEPGSTVSVNPGNLPATATSSGCSQDDMSGVPSTMDGFLFVASPDNFTSFTATFSTGTVTLANQGATTSTLYFTKPYEHLLVIAPAGAVLTAASATLDGDRDFFTLSHTCAASETVPSPTVSPTVSPTDVSESPCAEDMDTETPGCQTESPTPSVSPTEVSESPCSEDTDTETEGCQTASPTVSPTVLPTEISQSPCAEDMDTETPGCQTASETPSAEVSATEFTQSPTPTESATVEGVKVVRTPTVLGSRLPSTGSPLPIGLLLLVGFGLVGGGVVVTVAGEGRTAAASGKHRA
jgi:hypothetical protein